jgi:hypothetical protein
LRTVLGLFLGIPGGFLEDSWYILIELFLRNHQESWYQFLVCKESSRNPPGLESIRNDHFSGHWLGKNSWWFLQEQGGECKELMICIYAYLS